MTNWSMNRADNLPEEDVIVDTISADGIEQQLKRLGRLWFLPDGSSYVYYEVKFWRHVQEVTGSTQLERRTYV